MRLRVNDLFWNWLFSHHHSAYTLRYLKRSYDDKYCRFHIRIFIYYRYGDSMVVNDHLEFWNPKLHQMIRSSGLAPWNRNKSSMVRIWVYPGPQASWRVLVVKTHPLGLVPVSKIYDLDHSGSAPTGFELGLYATLHLRLCGHQPSCPAWVTWATSVCLRDIGNGPA